MKSSARAPITSFFQRVRNLLPHGPKAPPLLSLIKNVIRKEGPITIERYMHIVLQHPQHGYYRHGDPIGVSSDFGTAPELSQMFGEMIGLWCMNEWEKLGRPDPFVLLELGPGHGTLMHDLLRFTEPIENFHQALRVRLFDSSETLRAKQVQMLEKYSPLHIDDLDNLEKVPTIIIANEFFDNMPVRQFGRAQDGWRETMVGLKWGRLKLVAGQELYACPDPLSSDDLKTRPQGWIHEVSAVSREIVRKLAAHIVENHGAAIFIDYGYDTPIGTGTLDAWYQSKAADILTRPGETDVTADVDFVALKACALEHGVMVDPIIPQGRFLAQAGISTRAEILKGNADESAKKKIDNALRVLTSPSEAGSKWKVMAFRSPPQ